MTQLTDRPVAVDSTPARTTLARITGTAGLVTLVVVLGAALANNYQSASFTSDADGTVRFFRSIDDTFGASSSFATAVGLIAMLWFTLGLALLLRQYDGPLAWRSNSWVALGAVSLCAGLIMISSKTLPTWLGWWAIVAGIGQVIAREFWTHGIALVPGTGYWIWVAVLSVLLIRGRFAICEDPR